MKIHSKQAGIPPGFFGPVRSGDFGKQEGKREGGMNYEDFWRELAD
jgi:hypothetical protein